MSASSAKKFSAQQDISGLFSITSSSPGRHIILLRHVAQLWGGDYCLVPQPSSGPGHPGSGRRDPPPAPRGAQVLLKKGFPYRLSVELRPCLGYAVAERVPRGADRRPPAMCGEPLYSERGK